MKDNAFPPKLLSFSKILPKMSKKYEAIPLEPPMLVNQFDNFPDPMPTSLDIIAKRPLKEEPRNFPAVNKAVDNAFKIPVSSKNFSNFIISSPTMAIRPNNPSAALLVFVPARPWMNALIALANGLIILKTILNADAIPPNIFRIESRPLSERTILLDKYAIAPATPLMTSRNPEPLPPVMAS